MILVKTRLPILLALLLGLNSCSPDPCYTKEQFVDSTTAFFDEFEKASGSLTEKEITQFEARYADLLENCYSKYKPEMSPSERRNFWKSSVRFYLEKEGGIFNIDFEDHDGTDPVKSYIVTELREMADSTTQDFTLIMESLLEDELPRLIDSFVGKVEEVGEELKASLQKEKE